MKEKQAAVKRGPRRTSSFGRELDCKAGGHLPYTYIHCLHVAITTPHEGTLGMPFVRSLLMDKPPSPGKIGHTTYSFRTVVLVLLSPTRCAVRQDTRVFRPRRLESLIVCWCHYKGSTFFSVILRPWVLARPRFKTLDLSLSRPALSELS